MGREERVATRTSMNPLQTPVKLRETIQAILMLIRSMLQGWAWGSRVTPPQTRPFGRCAFGGGALREDAHCAWEFPSAVGKELENSHSLAQDMSALRKNLVFSGRLLRRNLVFPRVLAGCFAKLVFRGCFNAGCFASTLFFPRAFCR